MSNYGKAIRKPGYWFADSAFVGSPIVPNTGVIHTTETTTLPDYEHGSMAPTYTGIPNFRSKTLDWVAHFPDEMSARALRNTSGGVETNTLNCVQVELVGTCDEATSRRWGTTQHVYWSNAPDWALSSVADFVADMNKRHKIPITGPGKPWVAYPQSYGLHASQRMNYNEWLSFSGWCGHQHVPENDHGDPGSIDWSTIETLAKEIVTPEQKPTPAEAALSLVTQALNVVNAALKINNKPAVRLRAARTALRSAKRALEGDTDK